MPLNLKVLTTACTGAILFLISKESSWFSSRTKGEYNVLEKTVLGSTGGQTCSLV